MKSCQEHKMKIGTPKHEIIIIEENIRNAPLFAVATTEDSNITHKDEHRKNRQFQNYFEISLI